jgi:hypothetical protein
MIAYCITVYNELKEISRLLPILSLAKETDDEIIVLHTYSDENEKLTQHYIEIEKICKLYASKYDNFYFQRNFADLKNYMNSKVSSHQKYIINFDADEIMEINMLKALKNFLLQTDVDLFFIPRVNIVTDITDEDIKKWNWRLNENGWINWPDYQPRIYKNLSQIRWVGKVHEHLEGHNSQAAIQQDGTIFIYHEKTIDKQRQQNLLYEKIGG